MPYNLNISLHYYVCLKTITATDSKSFVAVDQVVGGTLNKNAVQIINSAPIEVKSTALSLLQLEFTSKMDWLACRYCDWLTNCKNADTVPACLPVRNQLYVVYILNS